MSNKSDKIYSAYTTSHKQSKATSRGRKEGVIAEAASRHRGGRHHGVPGT
jgi:hypothetical protein